MSSCWSVSRCGMQRGLSKPCARIFSPPSKCKRKQPYPPLSSAGVKGLSRSFHRGRRHLGMPKLTRRERLFAFADEAQGDVVTSSLVRRRQPSLEDAQGFLSAGDSSSKTQHIGVVVSPG